MLRETYAEYALLAVLVAACSSTGKPASGPPIAEAPPPSAPASPPGASQNASAEPPTTAPAPSPPELPAGELALLNRRERELREVIEQNMSDDGVNGDTVTALKRAVTPPDLPALERILEGDDLVHARAAAEVLLGMGPEGRALLRQSAEHVKGRSRSEVLLQHYLGELERIARPKNLEELLEVCHRGHAGACQVGAMALERGQLGPVDVARASKYYQLACKGGRQHGCRDAARLNGKVTP